jgi:hypothetical protein
MKNQIRNIVAGTLAVGMLSLGGVAGASGTTTTTTTTFPKGPYGWIVGRLVQKDNPALPALCTQVYASTLQQFVPGLKGYLPDPHIPVANVNRFGYYRIKVPIGNYSLVMYPAMGNVKGCPPKPEYPNGAPVPGFYQRNYYNGTTLGTGPWNGIQTTFEIRANQTFHVITTEMWASDLGAYRGQPVEGGSSYLKLYGDGFSTSSSITSNAPGVIVGTSVQFNKTNPVSLSPTLTTNLVITRRAKPGNYQLTVTTPGFGVVRVPLTLAVLHGTTTLAATLGIQHLGTNG